MTKTLENAPYILYEVQNKLSAEGKVVLIPFGVTSSESINFAIEGNFEDVTKYLTGSAVFDKKQTAMNITIELEETFVDNEQIMKMYPSYFIKTGTKNYIGQKGSVSMRNLAKGIVARPAFVEGDDTFNHDTDDDYDIVLFKAINTGTLQLEWSAEGTNLPLTFEALPTVDTVETEGGGTIKATVYGRVGGWVADYEANKGSFFNTAV